MCALPPRARAGLAPPRPPHGRAQPASRPNVARGRRSRAGGREHLRLARPTPQLRPDAARCPAAAFLPPRTAARREMSRPSSLLSLPSLAFPSRDSAPHEYGPRTMRTKQVHEPIDGLRAESLCCFAVVTCRAIAWGLPLPALAPSSLPWGRLESGAYSGA